MVALFFLGFATLSVLAGAFSYSMSMTELFLINGLAYLIFKYVLEKRTVLLLLTSVALVTSLGSGIYLYNKGLLAQVYEESVNFILPYYYSVRVKEYYIGRLHQLILLFLLGLIIYRIFVTLYYFEKTQFIPPLTGMLVVIPSFLYGTFSGVTDRIAFVIYITATYIYYYDIYFVRLKDASILSARKSFYFLAFIMSFVTISSAYVLHSNYGNPFEKHSKAATVAGENGEVDSSIQPFDNVELIYKVSDEYKVQSTFTHQGIELFRVRADTLKYFKSQTYNEYIDGTWINTQTSVIRGNDWPVEPILRLEVPYNEAVFIEEEVQVIYENIYTDAIITAPFTKDIIFPQETKGMSVQVDGAVISEQMLGKDFFYTLRVLIPKYGTKAFSEFLDLLPKARPLGSGNSSFVNVFLREAYSSFPTGYEKILELSNDITRNAASNIDKALAIENYLKNKYTYSETPLYRDDEDMMEQFLFESKEGFCQQFATSMVLLLRAQNIPSRFVTGYVITETDTGFESIPEEIMYREGAERNHYQSIYDSSAHSWVEIYEPEFGWIQFEPTPGQSAIQFSDSLEASANDTQDDLQQSEQQVLQKKVLLYSLLGLVLLLLLYSALRITKRYKNNKRDKKQRLIRTYHLLLRYLKAMGFGKEKAQTLREYGAYLENRLINSRHNFNDYVAFLENAFYNQVILDDEELLKFEVFLEEIKELTKGKVERTTYRRLRLHEIVMTYRGK